MASARADTSPRHSSHSAGSMRRHVYVSCDGPPGTTRALNVLMDVCARKAGRAPLSVCIMHYVRMSFYAGMRDFPCLRESNEALCAVCASLPPSLHTQPTAAHIRVWEAACLSAAHCCARAFTKFANPTHN